MKVHVQLCTNILGFNFSNENNPTISSIIFNEVILVMDINKFSVIYLSQSRAGEKICQLVSEGHSCNWLNNLWSVRLICSIVQNVPVVALFGVNVASRTLVHGGTVASVANVGEAVCHIAVDAGVERNVRLVSVPVGISSGGMTRLQIINEGVLIIIQCFVSLHFLHWKASHVKNAGCKKYMRH